MQSTVTLGADSRARFVSKVKRSSATAAIIAFYMVNYCCNITIHQNVPLPQNAPNGILKFRSGSPSMWRQTINNALFQLNGAKMATESTVVGFLPRDALVHSAVLRLHVVRPSVRPSVCNVGGSGNDQNGP